MAYPNTEYYKRHSLREAQQTLRDIASKIYCCDSRDACPVVSMGTKLHKATVDLEWIIRLYDHLDFPENQEIAKIRIDEIQEQLDGICDCPEKCVIHGDPSIVGGNVGYLISKVDPLLKEVRRLRAELDKHRSESDCACRCCGRVHR